MHYVLDVESCTVPAEVFALVHEVLRSAHASNDGRGRYRDDGYTYDVAGTADEVRHVALGGFWNDLHGRAPYGIAPEDASVLAGKLRAIGYKLRNADADALLLQCEMGYLRTMSEGTDLRARWRTSKAAQRAKARDEGRCTICTSRPVSAEGRATCTDCQGKANAALARRRKARRVT